MSILSIIGLASKLLPLASAVPEVLRVFGSDKQADAAERMVNIAKGLTGKTDSNDAVAAVIADPALQLQYQQALINERVRFREMELQDAQAAHSEQQKTIRGGDESQDEYVRHTRPMMARQSWYGTALYVFAMEVLKALDYGSGASWEIALVLLSPAAAYLGFRTGDKFASAWQNRVKK